MVRTKAIVPSTVRAIAGLVNMSSDLSHLKVLPTTAFEGSEVSTDCDLWLVDCFPSPNKQMTKAKGKPPIEYVSVNPLVV